MTVEALQHANIKQIPREQATREAIRCAAVEVAERLGQQHPPVYGDLERHGQELLSLLSLPECYLGFAMVAISNAFWQRAFAAVPFNRRLLLLPNCLRDASACSGYFDSIGLHCQGCGCCGILDLRRRAEALGYQVLIAEGTSSVLLKILDGEADALLGVACLDSLEKSFSHISGLGIPQLAIPLLRDGCADTEAEIAEIHACLVAHGETSAPQPHSCMPLLRETTRGFSDPLLGTLLSPYLDRHAPIVGGGELFSATDTIALDWLKKGGKRLRPFITVAAYAVAQHGLPVLRPDVALETLIPPPVRRIALAIEALHKASLVHDDIEDDDAFRYGRQTLHREYGLAPAVNIGDYLVGLGYRIIAGQQEEWAAPAWRTSWRISPPRTWNSAAGRVPNCSGSAAAKSCTHGRCSPFTL